MTRYARRLSTLLALATLLAIAGCPQTDALPVLTSAAPSIIAAGSGNTNIILRGSGFKPPTNVQWNNSLLLATTRVNDNQLVATIPADELQFPGLATVRALQGSGVSQTATASLTITITSAVPTLTSIAPAHVILGSSGFTMTVVGTNFNTSSVVMWDTTALTTTFVSATQLTAAVPTTLYTAAGVSKITVVNSGTGGGTTAAVNITKVAVLVITTTTLPGGSLSVPYTATLAASGGTTPYTWSLTSGSLPVGLTLSQAGVISGTPTATGTASFAITVSDATGTLARKVFK